MSTIKTLPKELLALSDERILIIDDEISFTGSLSNILINAGYQVTVATSGTDGFDLFDREQPDILLVDIQMSKIDGVEFVTYVKSTNPHSIVIFMSGCGRPETAVEAIRCGASDFIAKPFSPEDLLLIIRKASERAKLCLENELLREQVSKRYSFSNIIAKSAEMGEVFEIIKKISDYSTTVLLQGESGTGKELVARAIHYNSPRRAKRFIGINCGAIPENLLESELFGHKRGAFTDATKDKKGLFEEASGGTILLDEIGELPTHLQVKLLRVLQERVIRPVGQNRTIPIDVRIIAASLRDLHADIAEGRFRDDLFYRLNIISLIIPPLREHKDDIPLLVNHFIRKNQEKLGLPVYGITTEAMGELLNYSWPGNIRELENCIERSMILTDGNKITVDSLPKTVISSEDLHHLNLSDSDLSIKNHNRVLEEGLIRKALKKTAGNRTHAAKLLEISHRTLLYKIKEYGLANNDTQS